MKDCRDFQKNLPAFLEGLLPEDEKRLLENHLAGCSNCAGALKDLQKTQAVLSGLPEVEPPPWFTQKIMARVREEGEAREKGFLKRFFFPLKLKVPIQALATIAIVFMAVYLYRSTEPEMKAMQAPVETTREAREEKTGSKLSVQDQKDPAPAPAQKKAADEVMTKKDVKIHTKMDRGGMAEVPVKQEGFAPPVTVVQPPVAMRKGDTRSGGESKAREKEPVMEYSKQEAVDWAMKADRPPAAGSAPPAPAVPPARDMGTSSQQAVKALPREKERDRSNGFAASRIEKKAYGVAAPPASAPGAAVRSKQAHTSITMTVRDSETTIRDVETILRQYGARNVVTNQAGPFTVISARVPSAKMQEILKKLDTAGAITERFVVPETDYIAIKIRASEENGNR